MAVLFFLHPLTYLNTHIPRQLALKIQPRALEILVVCAFHCRGGSRSVPTFLWQITKLIFTRILQVKIYRRGAKT
jgi:hypothetical protein